MTPLQGHVLVVDDLDTNRDALARMLEREGLTTEVAQDGFDALEKVRAGTFDTILLDVMMPRLDGIQTLTILKQEIAIRDIPVIMLSALNDTKAIRECIELGADDYLPKPIDRSLLRARLASCLRRKQLTDNEKDYLLRLESTNEELRRLNHLKSRFLAVAAHDLKNPMTTILLLADQLSDALDDPAAIGPKRKQLQRIRESTLKMLGIIQALLDSAAAEAGQYELNLQPIDLAALAQEVVEDNRIYAESKQITLHCEFPTEESMVAQIDAARFRDVMDNLINNAIKFSPAHRTVWVSLEKTKGKILFRVKDQGPGLTEEDKKLVFGLYQRLSAQPTGSEFSTGLGLSIVKQRVELHGGRVWVESQHGEGATFQVELPVDIYQAQV
jgi:two-component system sensor histidine kinase/response regulator